MLRSHGLKATPQRIQVLELLSKTNKPAGIPDLLANKRAASLDTVTLYRSLEALVGAQLVRRVDLRHGHGDYELVREGSHHHHLVCEKCGDIEDIHWCPDVRFEKRILADSRFAKLTDHSIEFFGICNKCNK